MTSVFALPAHSYRVSTAKWKRTSRSTDMRGCPFSSGVTWQPLRELGMLLLPGDADALWFRTQEETGWWEEELESQHPCSYTDQASDVPRGTPKWSQLNFGLWQQDPFLKGKEKCPVLKFCWRKYLFLWPQWNKNHMCHILSQLLSNWAGAEIVHYFSNLEWTLISLFVSWPHIRGVIISTFMENAVNEVAIP